MKNTFCSLMISVQSEDVGVISKFSAQCKFISFELFG